MLTVFDAFRGLSFSAVLLKLLFSFICGSLIGLERSYKRRGAGLRTHILICLGAAITTLTGHYIYLVLGLPTDVSRIGAQVISGLGFIGAGTILVTKNHAVKGLTTAAGLWTSGIIGLTFGSGFYEAGITATLLILFVESVLSKAEDYLLDRAIFLNLYITYRDKKTLDQLLQFFSDHNISIINLELSSEKTEDTLTIMGLFSLRLKGRISEKELLQKLETIKGVLSVQTV